MDIRSLTIELNRLLILPAATYNSIGGESIVLDIVQRRTQALRSALLRNTNGDWHVLRRECDICRRNSPSAQELLAHRFTHTLDRRYTCLICYKTYASSSALYSHIMIVGREYHYSQRKIFLRALDRIYTCLMCKKTFPVKKGLRKHIEMHKALQHVYNTCAGERVQCDICRQICAGAHVLAAHRYTHTSDVKFICLVCRRSYTSIKGIRIHFEKVHSVLVLDTSSYKELNNYYKSACQKVNNTFGKFYKCGICCKQFVITSLRSHILTHTGEKPFECDICHKRFARKGDLGRHELVHTGERLHACDICHKRFQTKGVLIVHFRSHTGEKPFECDICRKRFITSSMRASHMTTHTRNRAHECSICHKRFSHKGSLTVHMRTHTGEKPYECSVCHKRFSFVGNFKKHLAIHTEEKPHGCDMCDKRFLLKSGLKSHVRNLHTVDKPHALKTKGELSLHMYIHTNASPYKCDFCHFIYQTKSGLSKHIKRIHNCVRAYE